MYSRAVTGVGPQYKGETIIADDFLSSSEYCRVFSWMDEWMDNWMERQLEEWMDE